MVAAVRHAHSSQLNLCLRTPSLYVFVVSEVVTMRLSLTLLLVSALAVFVSVVLSQPLTDAVVVTSAPLAADETIQLAPSTTTDAMLDVNAVPLTAAELNNNSTHNTTDLVNSTSATDTAMSALLASLDTTQMTAAQRSSAIAAELDRMQLLSDEHMSTADRHRLAATMDAWLQLPADEKLTLIRQQQAAYMRAMRVAERRRLAELVHSMDELTTNDDEDSVDDGAVRHVRLVRVRPVHRSAVAAEFAASQMEPMREFAAQQMELPMHFGSMLQMDEHYGVY